MTDIKNITFTLIIYIINKKIFLYKSQIQTLLISSEKKHDRQHISTYIVPFHTACPHPFWLFLTFTTPSLNFSHCPSHIHMELDL